MMIKKVYAKNIRSLTEGVELDFTKDENFIRIGGRNGRGKSTILPVGLKILLGITPAKPHLTKNMTSGYYVVENENGVFGVEIYEKGNPKYYYTLVDGTKDVSSDTINHNRCIRVIRSHLGLDLDEELTGALNINENTRLNFISTNGRSDLSYLRRLIYSEEIEELQEVTKTKIKNSKITLDRNTTEIELLYREKSKVKYLDEDYLESLSKYVNGLMDVSDKTRKIKGDYLTILKGKVVKDVIGLRILQLNNGILADSSSKLFVLSRIVGIEETKSEVMKLKEKLHTLKLSLLGVSYCKLQVDKDNIEMLSNNIQTLNKSIKEGLEIDLKRATIKNEKSDIIKYLIVKNRVNELDIKDTYNDVRNYSVTLNNYMSTKLSLRKDLQVNMIGRLKGISGNLKLLINTKSLVTKSKLSYTNLLIKEIIQVSERLNIEEKELDEMIFKDERCILCLKER